MHTSNATKITNPEEHLEMNMVQWNKMNSCTRDLGIKMDSNEHGAMEQNEEHLETNISIYHARKTKQYAKSYEVMNRAIYVENFGT